MINNEILIEQNNYKKELPLLLFPISNKYHPNNELWELLLNKNKIKNPNFPKQGIYIPEVPFKQPQPELTPPSDRAPLSIRLMWTAFSAHNLRTAIADERRAESTDLVRSTLLPRYYRHGIDILTQVRLIHRAHMRGNEHYLFYPDQARRLLAGPLYKVDRLAGVMRSEDGLSKNIYLAGGLMECASFSNTPRLMQALCAKAEQFFPQNGINPQVNEQTVYHFVSAFQYILALIHPFYEGNGRTSEDSMYILWQRRPDLIQTVRFVSNDGLRKNNKVTERMHIINIGSRDLLRWIAIEMGLDLTTAFTLRNYQDLLNYLISTGLNPITAENQYLNILDRRLAYQIGWMDDFDALAKNPVVNSLASNLKASSPTYEFRVNTKVHQAAA